MASPGVAGYIKETGLYPAKRGSDGITFCYFSANV